MRRAVLVLGVVLTTLVALLPGAAGAAGRAEWRPGKPPISTPWTGQVGPGNALPEYPRPQLTRSEWLNLNGVWQWAPARAGEAPPIGRRLDRAVLVPFAVESALSGVMERHERMWYRREFLVPEGWRGRRVQLHFGAVDWRAEVWVNGVRAGAHTGGYTGFSFDITGLLRAGGNEVVVGVFDPSDATGIPVGKQSRNPGGVYYTAASGIWQTVWLEPVAEAHVSKLDITPDVANGRVLVVARASGRAAVRVEVVVRDGDRVVGRGSGRPGAAISVAVPGARLWSPDDPFLYGVEVRLNGGQDVVGSYFGMRSVGLGVVDGVTRPLLNGRFGYQMGTLDQGYWPDGIYTAPTDEALRFDIQAHKDLGFNTIRKHIKVEPARWYYWADRLGLLVWQDMPSMPLHLGSPTAAARSNFEAELREVYEQLRSVTSIVQWVVFNESWGEYDSARLAGLVRGWDPSRLVNGNSGSPCCGGDFVDDHIYVGPGSPRPPADGKAAVLGEYGSVGVMVPGHEWGPGRGVSAEMKADGAALEARYLGMLAQVQKLARERGNSAAIFTQLTDVEVEVNGLYTYDRKVRKVDRDRVRAANLALLSGKPVFGAVEVPLGPVSLQVTTEGLRDRYLRHAGGAARTDVVTGEGDPGLKADATWRVVPGLADPGCRSLESVNFPGEFLRHRGDRVHREGDDGSAGFRGAATWCARPGLAGDGVSFESWDRPGRFLRHYGALIWLADNSGDAVPGNNPGLFNRDSTWRLAPPWAG
ncbi:AbfB domain-containing protein [Crossiella sp. NPDC003009]